MTRSVRGVISHIIAVGSSIRVIETREHAGDFRDF